MLDRPEFCMIETLRVCFAVPEKLVDLRAGQALPATRVVENRHAPEAPRDLPETGCSLEPPLSIRYWEPPPRVPAQARAGLISQIS